MLLGNGATTAATGGALQGALDRENELISLRQVGLEHAHIRNIERDGDKRLLGHGASSVNATTAGGGLCPNPAEIATLNLGTFMASPIQPQERLPDAVLESLAYDSSVFIR